MHFELEAQVNGLLETSSAEVGDATYFAEVQTRQR